MDDFVRKALGSASRNGLLVDGEALQHAIDVLCVEEATAANALEAAGLMRPDATRDALAWVCSRGHLDVTSTKGEVLRRLLSRDAEIAHLLRYRSSVANLRIASAVYGHSTTTEMGNRIVRCEWTEAVTARIYTKSPNLQCSPDVVRRCIYARENRIFVMVDWAAAELLAVAGFADDRELCNLIYQGDDVHQFTADALGVDRRIGKLVNLGLLYGMTGKGMADYTGLPIDECNDYIMRWLNARPKIRDFRRWAIANARINGGVTIGGLNIPIPPSEWASNNDLAARHAICYLGQGAVAHALQFALSNSTLSMWLRLPLHDGALYEVPFSNGAQIRRVLAALQSAWGGPIAGVLPRVRIRTGLTWHDVAINGDSAEQE